MKLRILLGLLVLTSIAGDVTAQNRTHRRRGIILGGLAGAALGVAIGDKGNNETAGALIGAAAGAIAGGAIGNQKDERIEQEIRFNSDVYGSRTSGYRQPAWSKADAYRSATPLHRHSPTELNRQYSLNRAQTPPRAFSTYDQLYVYPQGRRYLAGPDTSPAGRHVDYLPQTPHQVLPHPSPGFRPLSLNDVLNMTRNGVSTSLVLRQIQIQGFRGHLGVTDIIALHSSGISDEIIEAMQIYSQQPSAAATTPPPKGSILDTATENVVPPPPVPSR